MSERPPLYGPEPPEAPRRYWPQVATLQGYRLEIAPEVHIPPQLDWAVILHTPTGDISARREPNLAAAVLQALSHLALLEE